MTSIPGLDGRHALPITGKMVSAKPKLTFYFATSVWRHCLSEKPNAKVIWKTFMAWFESCAHLWTNYFSQEHKMTWLARSWPVYSQIWQGPMFIMTQFQASSYWTNEFSFGKSSSVMRLRDKDTPWLNKNQWIP